MKSIHPNSSTQNTTTTDINNNKKNLPGIWVGIDLGTTNTTAAFYSPNNHVSKLIRFTPSYSSIQKHNNKFGKILPSALYYEHGFLKSIGKDALLMNSGRDNDNQEGEGTQGIYVDREGGRETKDVSRGVLLTSVKRIWGMDKAQIKDAMHNNPSFLDSCPFQTVWDENGELKIVINDEDKQSIQQKNRSIEPIEVAEILLRTIREEATAYFIRESRKKKKKYQPLGYQENQPQESDGSINNYKVRHCIITVPAHFSRNQREKIVNAAKNAGFDGYVNTLVESTAASMSYGLFVSPITLIQPRSPQNTSMIDNNDGDSYNNAVRKKEGRKILVFDMGGGTTDITIADMLPRVSDDNSTSTEVSFQVLATAGERTLGGDDMDEALALFVTRYKINNNDSNVDPLNTKQLNQLRMLCCHAKQSLCGDGKDSLPQNEAIIKISDEVSIVITQEEFCNVIQHLVDKAAVLVEKTLISCNCTHQSIDEVILVGGATRTPAVRSMLQSKFQKNELCSSIDADAAVAQGAAIQCAIVSGLVPIHELRNALMLDALPHSIGVLVSMGDADESYVPILESGMTLPAMNYATFSLSDIRQKGVTIIAVEDVDESLPLERVGEFNFLLHRLSEEELAELDDDKRSIDVGMTVDVDGRLIVSIFDKNDPDDLKKKEQYQQWKKKQASHKGNDDKQKYILGINDQKLVQNLRREEKQLIICSILLFCFYFIARILFSEPGKEGAKII